MTVLQDVLAWSATLPDWQRDALRRIVRSRTLSAEDFAELAELCKRPHGLSATDITPQTLGAGDVPAEDHRASVALVSVKHVSDVNALERGEEITFGVPGLTVVYGHNGAGKSSYARILKRACRARGSGEPVLPNALSEAAGGPPTAEITFTAAEVQKAHLWQDGEPSASELGLVSVFDSGSAQVYVADKTEVAFRPFGLDVLDKLAVACTEVRSRLEKEKGGLLGQAVAWPTFPEGSAAARFLSALSALTTAEDVDGAANFSAEEAAELQRLTGILAATKAEDPAKRGAELRTKADRIAKLKDHLKGIAKALGVDATRAFDRTRRQALEAESAAELAKRAFTQESQLPEAGGAAWRRLWEAARAYSESDAYRGHRFPHSAEGARCVLCQQTLGAEARGRLETFERFVQGEVLRRAKDASDALEGSVRGLEQIRTDAERHTVDDLIASFAEVGAEVARFVEAATKRRDALAAALRAPPEALLSLDIAPPTERLDHIEGELRRRADELGRAADPEKRRATEARVAALEGRKKLQELKPTILGDIRRRARLNAYDKAIKDTATAAITRESTDLTKRYVTEALASGFEAELKKFGFSRPELVLKPAGGQKGALYHQVVLKHATKAHLPSIMSEGEARCLALAAFLAEVRSAGTHSTIVFDDPVSSLDHRWRSRMADRLAGEAKERQVIVFTHELVFLYELIQAAERESVPSCCRTVARVRDAAGCVEQDLPWDARSTSKRIGALRAWLQTARKVLKDEGAAAYELYATRIYARLRQAWERAVEEVLLNGVVERFRDSVQTQKLKRAADVTATDYDAVEAGMTKCSKWEGGHDHALAMNEPVPLPDEVDADIKALDDFIRGIEKRRKK
jgi:energy-coupling factor transporter ATP-binding protein EcfA2